MVSLTVQYEGEAMERRRPRCASRGRSGLGSGCSDVEVWGCPWCVDGLEMLPKVGGQRRCPVCRDLGAFAVVMAGVVW
jgi:hypothetical protein